MLYNNLAEDLGRAEGPRAQLELARQGAAFTQRREIAEWVQPLGGLTARALADLGRIDEARALITKLLCADAERRWKQFEMPWERAHALLGYGRCLLALGRPAEAREPLHAAREIFASLSATPALTETGKCLARATALTG